MMHAKLIIGGTKKQRREAAFKGVTYLHPDTIILEPEEAVPAGRQGKTAISIDQVRDLQHQLSLKPHSAAQKIAIILEGQRLTPEAQNCLLKTLEEPPAHSFLILTTPSTAGLLPTVVSRCGLCDLGPQIDLDLESENHQKGVGDFLKLLGQGRGERLGWSESNKSVISSKFLVISLLDSWMSVLRDFLLIKEGCEDQVLNKKLPTSYFLLPTSHLQLLTSIEKAIETKKLLETTNVSPRLALEVFLLSLPTLSFSSPE